MHHCAINYTSSMPPAVLKHRLCALLAADAVGYSQRMGVSSSATVHALDIARDIFRTETAKHSGVVIDTAGDSVLCAFETATGAVQASVGVQQELQRCAAERPGESLTFRVGIHLGEVLQKEDGTIYGEGVNVAARLQALAPPGGVFVSDAIRSAVQPELRLLMHDQGMQPLKNIKEPVRAYSVGDPVATVESTGPSFDDVKKPSVAVLPFSNLSEELGQEYFSDGVVEDIVSSLSRLRWLLVVASDSSFKFKGATESVEQIGRTLGVKYLVKGTIRRNSERVRVSAQMVDAGNGATLWADRFDYLMQDIFELQDAIVESIVSAIEPSIEKLERQRSRSKPTESLQAYELYLHALPLYHQRTRHSLQSAQHLLRSAVEADEQFADAWGLLAACTCFFALYDWTAESPLDEAIRNARRTAEVGRDNGTALSYAAWVLATLGEDLIEAVRLAERALQLHPNSAAVLNNVGYVFLYSGSLDRALTVLEKARRLSPLDPHEYFNSAAIAQCHIRATRYGDALQWLKRADSVQTGNLTVMRHLVYVLVQLGALEDAEAVADRMLKFHPNMSIEMFRRRPAPMPRHANLIGEYIEAYRRVGVPER